jgi:hypothetical protein
MGAALLGVLAAPLPGCRKYIRMPDDAGLAVDTGTGGRGGTGGGGTSGVGGSDSSGPPPPPDVPAPPMDTRQPDRIPPDGALPVDMAECGQAGQRCCPGGRCANNGCCSNGICTPAFMSCPEVPASCTTLTCGGLCGGLRENCCGDAGYCVRELTICVRTDAGAKCETCGLAGYPCCRDNHCEPPGRCMNGRCM